MKKKTIASVVTATLLGMMSCQKESHQADRMTGPMTISAVAEGIGGPTKTETSYTYDVLWNEGDRILVYNKYFILIEGAGTTKGTFVEQESSEPFTYGYVTAYYPTSIIEGGYPVWPAVQTVGQGTPMYCKKEFFDENSIEFLFSSLGAKLQIVFKSYQKGVTLNAIEIIDGKKTLSGRFTVNGAGQAVITSTNGAGITLKFDGGLPLRDDIHYFNLSIPAGEYEDMIIIFRTDDGTRYVAHPKEKIKAERNKVSRITLTADAFTKREDVLGGKFSVAEGKQIMFSKGNLRYSVGTAVWSFYDKQYQYGPKDYNSGHRNEISLFTWGYNATKSIIPDGMNADNVSLTSGNLFRAEDWGDAIGELGDWRTLTREEWYYLLGKGDMIALEEDDNSLVSGEIREGKCKYGVNVCGVANCLIIAPDDWDLKAHPLQSSYGSSGSASSMSWEQAENAGLVCLPPAGVRKGTSVSDAGSYGYYWSSSAYSSTGASLNFFGSSGQTAILFPAYRGQREEGRSVRLVTNAF